MPTEALRASEAARQLDMPTKQLLRLIYERRIRYVMIEGIAHVPVDAIVEYESRSLSETAYWPPSEDWSDWLVEPSEDPGTS